MQKGLIGLHNHLYETIEYLTDRNLTKEALDEEVKRARAVAEVAEQAIKNGMLIVAVNRLTNSTVDMKSAHLLLE
jgi:hypothetical protein